MLFRLLRLFFGLPRATPTHCRCGAKADIIDSARPWIVWCARCHLKRVGKFSPE